MLKKIMIGTMSVLFIGSASLFSYRALEPSAVTTIDDSYISSSSVSSARMAAAENMQSDVQMTASPMTPGIHYFYFCKADNPDCTYINDYVFKPLAEELQTTTLEAFELYDLAPLGENYPSSKMKSQWGFESYPAFVSLTVHDDGTTQVNSVLSWNKEDPMDAELLKQWMIDNQIWTGEIEDQGELIEQPE